MWNFRKVALHRALAPKNFPKFFRAAFTQKNPERLLLSRVFFLTAIWLTHDQLWAILKATASLTQY